ncbi:hypothetical protein GCM10020000_02190 [Streptomyces olivoverticillatus]
MSGGESGPGPANLTTARKVAQPAEDPVAQPLRQAAVHDERPVHDRVGLGVPRPLGTPRPVLAFDEAGHLPCDGFGGRLFTGQGRFFGEAEVFVGAAYVDQPLHQRLRGALEHPVEGGPHIGVDAPFELDAPQDRVVEPPAPVHGCGPVRVSVPR